MYQLLHAANNNVAYVGPPVDSSFRVPLHDEEKLLNFATLAQIIKPAVADAAGQAEYAADRITREAVMPLAEAVAGQVRLGLTVSARRPVIVMCQ